MRIAAARVMQAKAISRDHARRSVSFGEGSYGSIRMCGRNSNPGAPTFDTVSIQASYIIDFWGQYRRATEAARANLVASEFGQDVVRTTLVADVASAYFQLRQYDAQLEYSKKTLEADQEMLNLNTIKFKGGESAETDVLQAELLVEQAEAQIISLQQSIEQTENAISILVGRNPGPYRARYQSYRAAAYAGSSHRGFLRHCCSDGRMCAVRRCCLVSANANVGVAKAAFFPQFALTGQFGAQSTSITSFLQGPATFWSLGGQVASAIVRRRPDRSNYRLAWAQARRSGTALQAVRSAGCRRRVQQPGWLLPVAKYRMKIEEQTATYYRNCATRKCTFPGGAHELPRSPGNAATVLQLRIGACASLERRAAELRAVVPGTWRRLGEVINPCRLKVWS